MTTHIEELNPGLKDLGRYEYGWADSDTAGATAKRGLSEDTVRDISARKSEPQWMLDLRLKSLKLFGKKPMPAWGSDLTGIDFQNIKYFVKSTEKQATSWEDLPADIKNTYDRLGIPSSPASPRSTSRRSSTTRSARTWRRRASSSSTPTPACASTRTCSASTSPR
jgi:Fe-S cluster assembly protein SufB